MVANATGRVLILLPDLGHFIFFPISVKLGLVESVKIKNKFLSPYAFNKIDFIVEYLYCNAEKKLGTALYSIVDQIAKQVWSMNVRKPSVQHQQLL